MTGILQVMGRPGAEHAGTDNDHLFLRALRCHAAAPRQDGCAARSTEERAARYVKTHSVSRVPAPVAAEAVAAEESGRPLRRRLPNRPDKSVWPELAVEAAEVAVQLRRAPT